MRVIAVLALASAVFRRVRCRATGSAARGVEAFVDLGVDQLRVGEQGGDVVPGHGVEVVGADRFVAADASALVAVVAEPRHR
jgi:methylglyoxal synthase